MEKVKKSTKDKKLMSVFRQLRAKAHLTQEQLAHELGVSFVTINRWENGKQKCSLDFGQWKKLNVLLMEQGIHWMDLPSDAFGKIRSLEDLDY